MAKGKYSSFQEAVEATVKVYREVRKSYLVRIVVDHLSDYSSGSSFGSFVHKIFLLRPSNRMSGIIAIRVLTQVHAVDYL